MRITCGQGQFKLLTQMAMQEKIGHAKRNATTRHTRSRSELFAATKQKGEAVTASHGVVNQSAESIIPHPEEYQAEILAGAWGESVASPKIQALEVIPATLYLNTA